MPIKLTFGESITVLESGTAIQFNQEPFLFQLNGLIEPQPVYIEIRFLTQTDDVNGLISFENGGPNHLIMNLTNFNNKINHGNVEPMRIGSLDNKELFFSFRLTSASENFPRTLEYTFYLGREVLNA